MIMCSAEASKGKKKAILFCSPIILGSSAVVFSWTLIHLSLSTLNMSLCKVMRRGYKVLSLWRSSSQSWTTWESWLQSWLLQLEVRSPPCSQKHTTEICRHLPYHRCSLCSWASGCSSSINMLVVVFPFRAAWVWWSSVYHPPGAEGWELHEWGKCAQHYSTVMWSVKGVSRL